MRAAVISFTVRGDEVNRRIGGIIGNARHFGKGFGTKKESVSEWTAREFKENDALIFIGAAPIAVRAAAPYIKSKETDPAILVIDEAARYVIPILSGHIGGANRLARLVAKGLGAQAVITTATDINGVWAVDAWAAENGYGIDDISGIKHISSALLDGRTVGLVSDFKISGTLPSGVKYTDTSECGICISDSIKKPFSHTLNLLPKRFVIGVGSRKDAEETALIELFDAAGINKKAVKAVATIDIKRDEPSVICLAEYLRTEIITYTARELNAVEGDFSASCFVRSVTGTDCVCERAAAASGGEIVIRKTKGRGVTLAAAAMDWSVSF